MKRFILLFWFSAMFSIVYAQDYQCLKEGVEYTYYDSAYFKMVLIDTVIVDGDDLIYPNYKILGDSVNGYQCMTRKGALWIGRRMIITPEGDNIIFNKNDEPITFKPYKGVNEPWNCYDFDNGNYIKATIIEETIMQFIGLTDTVKKISFQAYNSSGNQISNSINSKQIYISKNHGLIRTLNFQLFPDLTAPNWDENCHTYDLVGLSNPDVGIQNLTVADVYDFEPGEEIHTYRKNQTWSTQTFVDEYYLKKYIISKQYTIGFDTVIYSIHTCGYKRAIHFNGIQDDTSFTYYNDTTTKSYRIDEDSIIDVLPDKDIIYASSDEWMHSFNSQFFFEDTEKRTKLNMRGIYSFYPHDCLFIILSKNTKYFGAFYHYYIEGLGGPYYHFDQVYSGSGYYEPVYYKKGNDEWGTPWTFDCDSLSTSIDNSVSMTNNITIAPNPLKTNTHISFPNKENRIIILTVYNSFGIMVREERTEKDHFIFHKGNLDKGIYFIVVSDAKKVIGAEKLVVQ